MHVDKPQRPRLGRPCNHQVPPHLFFDFSNNQNIQETPFLSFPTGPCKSEFSPHFCLFSLKERARSSLESSLKPTGQHLKKKIRLHIISSFYSLKATRTIKNSLPPIPTGPTPNERKTLSSCLPFILLGPATRKGKSFNARVILCLFPLKNHKLGKGSSYSHLRIHDFFKEFQ